MIIVIAEEYNEANEYVRMLSEAYQEAGHSVVLGVQNFLFSNLVPDIVHIQWPEAIYLWRYQLPGSDQTIDMLEARIDWYKSKGAQIVYTVHNIEPHEPVDLDFEQRIYRSFIRNSDVILHHGTKSIAAILDFVGEETGARHVVVPHGPYHADEADWKQARRRYGLPADKWVLLNFGRQRRNKGPDFTSRVFRVSKFRDLEFFTIGPRAGMRGSLARRAIGVATAILKEKSSGIVDRFCSRTTIVRHFAHDEISAIMAASDIVFLGHQQGLNSGVLALAASYGKPVVFPDLGNFKEQAAGWDWAEAYEAGSERSAAAALARMRVRLGERKPGDTKFDNAIWISEHSWQKHIQAIETSREVKSGAAE